MIERPSFMAATPQRLRRPPRSEAAILLHRRCRCRPGYGLVPLGPRSRWAMPPLRGRNVASDYPFLGPVDQSVFVVSMDSPSRGTLPCLGTERPDRAA